MTECKVRPYFFGRCHLHECTNPVVVIQSSAARDVPQEGYADTGLRRSGRQAHMVRGQGAGQQEVLVVRSVEERQDVVFDAQHCAARRTQVVEQSHGIFVVLAAGDVGAARNRHPGNDIMARMRSSSPSEGASNA